MLFMKNEKTYVNRTGKIEWRFCFRAGKKEKIVKKKLGILKLYLRVKS